MSRAALSEQTVLSTLSELEAHVAPGKRLLVLTSPSRRSLPELETALPERPMAVFDQARVHVPEDVVDAAWASLEQNRPDVLVSLGGGAATGLGKALMRRAAAAGRTDLLFVAVPTTYAGSEMTSIWGLTRGEGASRTKETGRDVRVRPALVVHDAALLASLPSELALQSLLNALAHSVSALSALDRSPSDESRSTEHGSPEGTRRSALHAVERVSFAARQMVGHHGQAEVRQDALRAAATAGRVLDESPMGMHHRLVHALGGQHDLAHAPVHALMLVQTLETIRREQPELDKEIAEVAGTANLAGFVHDALTRVGAPTSLKKLGLSLEQAWGAGAQVGAQEQTMLDAWLGSRPSSTARVRRWGEQGVPVVVDGDLDQAELLVLGLHGRGSNAWRAAAQVRKAVGHPPGLAIVAPQAPTDAWYDLPYSAPAADLGGPLGKAVDRIAVVVEELKALRPNARLALYGFSQGACLALELLGREVASFEHVFAIGGARPSGATDWPTSVAGTPVYLSLASEDAWVRADDVAATAVSLREAGADVTDRRRPGSRHAVSDRDRWEIRQDVRGRLGRAPAVAHGFGGHHLGEVLEGAVPRDQNIPRHSPYGLYPEQLSGTGFVARRHENQRTWVYRVRPSAQHTHFERVEHPTLTAEFERAPSVNLDAWEMPALEEESRVDFVDGLVTLGGAGHPADRRGYAVHLYRANADMADRSFTSADGDMILLPEQGALTLLTEMGTLQVAPGQIAVLPRGLRFSVLLDEEAPGQVARGYVGEIYAKHFVLPDRGPIGANGLADERHFVAPTPWYEDRLAVGYRMATKMGGHLYEATQDYSPYDVVGWQGSYLPYAYDASLFSPVSNSRIDHGDPSLYTVLSGGLDEQGAHALDLVVFPARWDPTEHTFRPPYFHRNVTTEINGIVRDPGLSEPFQTGMVFLTPSMTAHGVRARGVQSHLGRSDEAADRPSRSSGRAMWFQFETALHFCPTAWALNAAERRQDWPYIWGEYAPRFSPPSSGIRQQRSPTH